MSLYFRGQVTGSRRLAIYGIRPFEIQTITLERIFIDKLFAAETYTRNAGKENRAFEASKHIDDLAILSEQKKIKELLHDPEKMKYLLDIRMEEELNRLDGIPGVLPKDFIFFETAENNQYIKEAYPIMLDVFVLNPKDKLDLSDAAISLKYIHDELCKNPSWIEYSKDSSNAEINDRDNRDNYVDFSL